MSNNRLWILGAADPEMTTIERLLTEAGESVTYATGPDGNRVHPGNAYRAIGPSLECHPAAESGVVYLVECGYADGPHIAAQVVSIDHHREGDPGYGRPPEEFLAASSVGQVFTLLSQSRTDGEEFLAASSVGQVFALHSGPGCVYYHQGCWWAGAQRGVVPVPLGVVLTAAADHSLEAAYRGKCPGVEPDDLMEWRAESRAAHQGRTVEEVLADIEAARARLREAVARCEYEYPMGGGIIEHHLPDAPYADLRGEFIPELPEAAAREGIPFLSTVRDRDGREKTVLQAAPPSLVERFLAGEIVPGLHDLYGDPARGFAGGYLTPRS